MVHFPSSSFSDSSDFIIYRYADAFHFLHLDVILQPFIFAFFFLRFSPYAMPRHILLPFLFFFDDYFAC